MMRSRKLLGLLLVTTLLTGCDLFGAAPAPAGTPPGGTSPAGTAAPPAGLGPVNLQHLSFLVEDVTIAGRPMAITHIYSEFPKYAWVDAAGEGISALDDAARAALVYLSAYERRPDPAYLDKARRLLNFAIYLQADDGQFYNFITDRQGTINRTGNTSFLSSGWWAARGMWALASGYRIFKTVDPAYATELRQHFMLGRDAWTRLVGAHYGQSAPVHGVPVPGWLIDGGADVTGIAVLALLEMDRAEAGSDAPGRLLLTQLGEGLAQFQSGSGLNYPWGMHPDAAAAPLVWHAWGSTQATALARAGVQLGHPDWVASARKEADLFFTRFVAGPMAAEWGVLPVPYPQIAYGVDSLTQTFLALYAATGETSYAQRAGLTAAWFFGNNAAGVPMYDPATGRGFDGLQGANEQRVNRNSGAESTIEALQALLAIGAAPAAAAFLSYKAVGSQTWQVLEAEDAKQVRGDAAASYHTGQSTGEAQWSNGAYLTLGSGDAARLAFSVATPGRYYLYAAYLNQVNVAQPFAAEALRVSTPPVVDGALDDWAATQPLSATSASNIVRGAAGWDGPARDSFVGHLAWDADNLYVAARVLAPAHHQTQTGAEVWQGDALWVYVNEGAGHSTVAGKVTLAQTPSGPQVWDWKGGSFLPGARLAWRQGAGSYTYEAALPWKALNIRAPQAGQTLGVELGRGCCGNGFMDLAGTDPDVAANLVPLHLVTALSPARPDAAPGPHGPDAAALHWAIDGGPWGRHPEAGAPDRDYLTLERLASAPLELTAGDHTLDLEYAGSDPSRHVSLDGFLLLPALLQKTLRSDTGQQVDLTYEVDGGKLTVRGP